MREIECDNMESLRYEKGIKVKFIGYNKDELKSTPSFYPVFEEGDMLEVIRQGRGVTEDEDILVKRLSDGWIDMVFPEDIIKI